MKKMMLPELGEGVVEGEIVSWLISEGDSIQSGDSFVEVMTDKAIVEIPSPSKIQILKFLVKPGDIVPVGDPIADYADINDEPVLAQEDSLSSDSKLENQVTVPESKTTDNTFTPNSQSPHARRLSRLEQKSNQEKEIAVPAPANQHNTYQEVPLKGLRKVIAEKMIRAKKFAPHFARKDDVDMTNLSALRKQINSENKLLFPVSFLPFFIKACQIAMKDFPNMNSTMDESKNALLIKHYFNFSVAMATDKGLTVPVIRNVNQKSIYALAEEINALSKLAKDSKLRPEHFGDGTFTITSLGKEAGLMSTPILNHPEVAILGINRIIDSPVVINSEIVIRKKMNLSGVFDHRVIDGHYSAAWMNRVIYLLENPLNLLLH